MKQLFNKSLEENRTIDKATVMNQLTIQYPYSAKLNGA